MKEQKQDQLMICEICRSEISALSLKCKHCGAIITKPYSISNLIKFFLKSNRNLFVGILILSMLNQYHGIIDIPSWILPKIALHPYKILGFAWGLIKLSLTLAVVSTVIYAVITRKLSIFTYK